MGAFSLSHLIIFLIVIVLVFGTKKLSNLGSDLGSAIKGFKNAMDDGKPGDKPNGDAQQLTDDKNANNVTKDASSEKVDEKR
jgi:sec-independent protein translocase protein TatA